MHDSDKKFRERYYSVVLRISASDIVHLTDFMSLDRKEASVRFFGCVQDNMGLFEEAATRQGGIRQTGSRRDVYLLRMPRYKEVIRFLDTQGRRLEVRALVKEAILTGQISERARQRLMLQERSPKGTTTQTTPVENLPWFEASPFREKPSPSVLFDGGAESVVKALLEDVLPAIQAGDLAQVGFRYDWLAISPEQYPEAVRSIPTFDMLRQLGILYSEIS